MNLSWLSIAASLRLDDLHCRYPLGPDRNRGAYKAVLCPYGTALKFGTALNAVSERRRKADLFQEPPGKSVFNNLNRAVFLLATPSQTTVE